MNVEADELTKKKMEKSGEMKQIEEVLFENIEGTPSESKKDS